MARLLLVPASVGRAHVARCVLVARVLEQRGHDTAFACAPGYDDLLGDRRRYDAFEVAYDSHDAVLSAWTPAQVARAVDEELAAVADFRPDVLVTDLRPTAWLTSRAAGVAHATVVNAYQTRHFAALDLVVPPGGRRRDLAVWLGGRKVALIKRELAAPFDEVARDRDLPAPGSLDSLLEGDATLVADHPDWTPGLQLPDGARHIGPLVWEPDAPVPDLPTTGKPLLYATTGHTGGERLADLVIEALSPVDVIDVVLTVGPSRPLPQDLPAHIHAFHYVPAGELLPRAGAAIHPGGNGTTYQVAMAGRPAIAIPTTADQTLNSLLAKRAGVVLPLVETKVSPRVLRSAVTRVTEDPEMLVAVAAWADKLALADAPERAADAILELSRD